MHISNKIQTFTYLGGKFSYLPWLLPLIDVPCKHRVDVFGGSAVVLLNMEPAPIETYNDINGKLVNFFKVLRDQPEELIAKLQLTPHSREEYDAAWYVATDTPVEQARKFFIRTQQSLFAAGAQNQLKGWACSIRDSRVSLSEWTSKWLGSIEGLEEVALRFKTIQIENRDFRFVMKNYDDPNTFFYCDSPYMKDLRSSTKYEFDFENQDHIDLHYYASNVKGKIAISSYDCEFMRDLYKDFTMHVGPERKNNRSNTIHKECLWTNY